MTRADARRASSRGFSLLEALVALAILASALPAIHAVFSSAVARAARADDRLETLRRAQDLVVLATAQFQGRLGAQSGTDPGRRWSIETSLLPNKGGEVVRERTEPVPVQLRVVVTSEQGAHVQLDTMFLYREPR